MTASPAPTPIPITAPGERLLRVAEAEEDEEDEEEELENWLVEIGVILDAILDAILDVGVLIIVSELSVEIGESDIVVSGVAGEPGGVVAEVGVAVEVGGLIVDVAGGFEVEDGNGDSVETTSPLPLRTTPS
ncbi:hypothetical protein MMC19_001090 [Ptychographa xylographoides]|nr:hypothetical protein [Ptychographa xylographoides]